MRPFLKLLVASLKEFRRDRTTLSFTIILPLLLVAFFGFAFGGSSTKLRLGISQAGSVTATMRSDVRTLRANPNVHLEFGSASAEMAHLRDGSLDAVLTINGPNAKILYDRNSGGTVLAVQALSRSLGRQPGPAFAAASPVVLQPESGLGNSRLDFVIPGILATAIMWLGIFAAIPLVQQREQQVLRRLAVTPVSRMGIVFAQVLSRLMVSLLQAAFILAAARLLFGVPLGSQFGSLGGSLALIAGLAILGALAFVALGYAVAALSATQSSAHAWAQLLSMPMLVLAGVFFPITLMPGVLRPVIAVLPLTYLADALRQTAMSGEEFVPLAVDMAVLTAWAVVALGIAIRFFRWSE